MDTAVDGADGAGLAATGAGLALDDGLADAPPVDELGLDADLVLFTPVLSQPKSTAEVARQTTSLVQRNKGRIESP